MPIQFEGKVPSIVVCWSQVDLIRGYLGGAGTFPTFKLYWALWGGQVSARVRDPTGLPDMRAAGGAGEILDPEGLTTQTKGTRTPNMPDRSTVPERLYGWTPRNGP